MLNPFGLFTSLAIWAISIALACTTTWHFTSKYYTAEISALTSKWEANNAKADAAERIKTTIAASRAGALGVQVQLAAAQLDSANAERLAYIAKYNGVIGNLADMQRVLNAANAASNGSESNASAATSSPVPAPAPDSDPLGSCQLALRAATSAHAANDSELQWCGKQLTGWSNFYNGVGKDTK